MKIFLLGAELPLEIGVDYKISIDINSSTEDLSPKPTGFNILVDDAQNNLAISPQGGTIALRADGTYEKFVVVVTPFFSREAHFVVGIYSLRENVFLGATQTKIPVA